MVLNTNCKQFVTITGFNLNVLAIIFNVLQGSVLESLLFLININDFNLALKHCEIHHPVDDTNLLNIKKSAEPLNAPINKKSQKWLNVNKICILKNRNGYIQTKKKTYGLQP